MITFITGFCVTFPFPTSPCFIQPKPTKVSPGCYARLQRFLKRLAKLMARCRSTKPCPGEHGRISVLGGFLLVWLVFFVDGCMFFFVGLKLYVFELLYWISCFFLVAFFKGNILYEPCSLGEILCEPCICRKKMIWERANIHIFLGSYWYLVGASKNRGTPKWMVKIMENPIKMDDLGVPLFSETSLYLWFRNLEVRGIRLPGINQAATVLWHSSWRGSILWKKTQKISTDGWFCPWLTGWLLKHSIFWWTSANPNKNPMDSLDCVVESDEIIWNYPSSNRFYHQWSNFHLSFNLRSGRFCSFECSRLMGKIHLVWYTLEDSHGTYSHHPFRKENDLNQTLRELCSMLIFRGVYFFRLVVTNHGWHSTPGCAKVGLFKVLGGTFLVMKHVLGDRG